MKNSELSVKDSLSSVLAALRSGRAERALQLCDRYLSQSPGSVPHLQLKGHALVRLEKPEAAMEQFELALKLAPDYAPLYEDIGSLQALCGDHEFAAKSLRRAVQIDPTLATAHHKLARVLQEIGRSEDIDDAMAGFLDHDEDAAIVAEGAEHWRCGRDTEAEEVLRRALYRNPRNVDAMRFLAMVYHRGGERLDDAEALLRKAVAIAPDFHQALGNLGRVLIDSNKSAEAVETYRRLIGLKPGDYDAWAGLGRALAHQGDIESAAEAYQQSLAINEASAQTHMALAHMLKTLGRQDEALRAYRRSISLKPGLGESYWSMANLKIFRFEPGEVAAMELEVARPDVADQARVNFHFALGKAYEDRKDYGRAWQNYHRGNQLQRQRVDYDPVENELHLQQIRETFSRELFDAHAGAGCDAPDPIFIVGLPRSGSTLVEQILASHSRVEGTAELPNLMNIATGTGRYRNDGLVYPQTVTALSSRDFLAYGREYLKQVQHHRVQGRSLFIDKMPNNFIHVGWIKLTLPNAKIINTRRHPMDSCLGAYKQLFARGQHFTYDMLELSDFYRSYVGIMNHWHETLPGFVLDAHYEDTVTDLEGQVRLLLDFCGLPFEEQCLRYYQTDRAVKTASSEQVRQPIYTGALGLWRNYGDHLQDWQEELADVIRDLPPSVIAAAGGIDN